jgi:hypothetical protein
MTLLLYARFVLLIAMMLLAASYLWLELNRK